MSEARGPRDVVAWATRHGIPVILHDDLPPVHSVAAASEALGIPADRVGKTVLFSNAGKPIGVLARGPARVDDRAVIDAVGGSRRGLRMARPEEVLEWTRYPAGGVPPFAHRHEFPLLFDDALPHEGRVVFGGGSTDSLLEIDMADLLAYLPVRRGAFTRPATS